MQGNDGTEGSTITTIAPLPNTGSPEAIPIRWRVLLVDHQPFTRRGLSSMLEALEGVQVVGEASTVAEAFERLRTIDADLVLLDAGPNNVGATLALKTRVPHVAVVVITDEPDRALVIDAFRAGAVGLVEKSADPSDLREMLRSISDDGVYLRSADTGLLLAALGPKPSASVISLTPRERQVLELLAEGATARAIGGRLGIGERTVNTYVGSMYRKFGVTNRVAAVRAAIKQGLMAPPA